MVAIQIHPAQMQKLERALGNIKNGVPKALTPAVNRALSSGQTVVKREIRKEYVIKAKDIPIKIDRASYRDISGAIMIKQGMLEVAKFRYRPLAPGTRRPVFIQIRTGGGGYAGGNAFVANAGGYLGPFRRKGASRLPIKKLLAIGAPIMASQPAVGPAVNKAMGDTLDKRIDHEMKRVLAQAGGK